MNCMNFNELHELEHLWGGLSACRLWCSSHLASHALKRRKDVMFSCFRCRVRKSRWIFINLNLQIFFPQKSMFTKDIKSSNLQLSNPFVAKLSYKPTFPIPRNILCIRPLHCCLWRALRKCGVVHRNALLVGMLYWTKKHPTFQTSWANQISFLNKILQNL